MLLPLRFESLVRRIEVVQQMNHLFDRVARLILLILLIALFRLFVEQKRAVQQLLNVLLVVLKLCCSGQRHI